MSDRERESFLHRSITRGPGKRQIKPTSFATEEFALHEEDESDDEFVGESDGSNESGSDGNSSNEDESEGEDEEEEEEESSDIEVIEGTSSGKPEPLICSVCLNTRNAEGDRVIQCDRCGVAVHEGCYGVPDSFDDDAASVISNFSTEPWFCEPCLFDLDKPPHCELCPQQFGAFKRADVGGRWVHLTCALFTSGISFGDVEHLSAISWQEIDYRRFGRKACDGCQNILEARTGITTQCEAGLCKNHFHISCAQRLGLLIDAESENLPELSGKHIDPHFILCRSHNITELIAKKRQNYAIFMRQEQKRFVVLNRRLLDQRESFKLEKQRAGYDDRIKKYCNETIHLPSIKNKRPRLLQSSADFLESFTEKAELFGVSLQEFTDGFTRLPHSQISLLPPSFSTEFVKYYEHRESTVFADEEKRLHDSECELKMVVQAEQDLKLMLGKLSTKSPDNSRTVKHKFPLEQKFMNLCKKLNITIEEEEKVEETNNKPSENSKISEPPKLKRQKTEEPPAKRQRTQSNAQKETSRRSSKSQSTATNFLKNGDWRQSHINRSSSRLTGSVDTTLESEEDEPALPSSSNSPPCLKAIDDLDSLTSDYSDADERPILLPMISAKTDETVKKRLLTSKNSKAKKREY